MNLRKAVTRLIVVTLLLLAIAWFGLKFMQFRGDWEAMIKDGQNMMVPFQDFVKEKVLPLLENAAKFIEEKLSR